MEAVGAGALVGEAGVVSVHQRVHKQVHGALVLALHHVHEVWEGRNAQVKGAAKDARRRVTGVGSKDSLPATASTSPSVQPG